MIYLTQNKHWDLVEDYNIDKLLYLLIDKPDAVRTWAEIVWFNKLEQSHRNYDLPSSIWSDGDIFWFKNNIVHRENNQPATIKSNGHKNYWINNKFIKEEKL